MAHLKVRLRGKIVSEITLQEGKNYTAGRKEDCEILLQSEKGISREHFQLISDSGKWELKVLSRFGDVLVGGEKVQSLILEEAHNFAVPPYEFEFTLEDSVSPSAKQAEAAAQSPAETENPPEQAPSLDPLSPSGDYGDRTVVGSSGLMPVVRFLDMFQATKKSVNLEHGNAFLAGREGSCYIHIDDQRVSRRQFEIKKINNGFFITDLGSVNGTYVNGEMINANEPVALKSGDTITVLDNQLVFELHDPNFQKVVSESRALAPLEPILQPTAPAPYEPQVPAPYDPNLYQQPAYVPPPPQGFDWKKHKVRIAIGVLGLILVIGLFSGGGSTEKKPKVVATTQNDPLMKLTEEQKMMVKHHYQLAENYLAQQKWGLAKDEIEKIKALLPDNYKAYERTYDLEMNAEQGLSSERQISEIEQQEQQKILQEQKISAQVEECQKLVGPDVAKEAIETCLQPVLQFNPEHPQIQQIRGQVDRIVNERILKEQQQKEQDKLAAQLHEMFEVGKRLEKSQNFLEAIAAYERVQKASLPDRGNYKSKAKRQVAALKAKMDTQTAGLLSKADKMAQDSQLKQAILALRDAQKIDPTNPAFEEKIDYYKKELSKNMQILFQEGILEEGFGNIEGNQERPGAKDKWRKILELDVPDGEYYQKAKQRLKKYGVI